MGNRSSPKVFSLCPGVVHPISCLNPPIDRRIPLLECLLSIQYIACIFTLYSAVRWTFLAPPTLGSGTVVLVVLTVVVTSSTTSTYQYENADPHLIHEARVYMMRSSYSSRLVKFHLRSFMLNHSCFDGQNANTIGSDIHPATRKWHGHKRKKAATVYVVCGTT